jgi:hypothetical protein
MEKIVHAESLAESARNWLIVGQVFFVLALVGSIAAGIVLCPETGGGYLSEPEKDTGVGLAIGVSVFIGSLVMILPYFMFSRMMSALAVLLPSSPALVTAITPVAANQGTGTYSSLEVEFGKSVFQSVWSEYVEYPPELRSELPASVLREACELVSGGLPAPEAVEQVIMRSIENDE